MPIAFTYRDSAGKEPRITPVFQQGILMMSAAALFPVKTPTVFLQAQAVPPSLEFSNFFSSLSKRKKQTTVVDALRREFKYIEDINVEVGISGQPTLYKPQWMGYQRKFR